MTKAFRVTLVIGLIVALLLPVIPFSRPEVVEAQGLFPPTVLTIDAWLHDSLTILVYGEVWASPGGYFWPFGYCEMYAQFREPGGEWTDSPKQRLTKVGYTEQWYPYLATARDITVEVRGAVDYYGNLGIQQGTLYGVTLEVNIPLVETDPWVSTGFPSRLSSTSMTVTAHGDPASEGNGDLYVQYRKVGDVPWSETAKEAINAFSIETWTVPGLEDSEPYEIRAALDYGVTTIYGEIRLLDDSWPDEDPVDAFCEYEPSGSGTSGDPYIITDVCELQWMRNSLDAYYELGNDIDASLTQQFNWTGTGYEGFIPVGGNITDVFTGNFNGEGYTIRNLYINRPTESGVGLFGIVSLPSSGTGTRYIQDFTIANADVTGQHIVGTLAGRTYGNAQGYYREIKNVIVRGSVVTGGYLGEVGGFIGYTGGRTGAAPYDSRVTVMNCHFEGTVTAVYPGDGAAAGFTAGVYYATAYQCSAAADVTVTSLQGNIGGFVGWNRGTIEQCYSTGTVDASGGTSNNRPTGGFAGRNSGSISDCYSRNTVIAPSGGANREASGFCGYSDGGSVENSYSTGHISGGTHQYGFMRLVGGTASDNFWDTQTSGVATSEGATGRTTAQMKTQSNFTDAGWDFVTIWGISPAINDGYPNLQALTYVLTVTTQAGTDIDASSFNAHGTITEADPNAHTRGFVYMEGISGEPTLSDDWVAQTGNYGTGAFTLNIAGLSPSTYYRVRAFAASDQVFAYGNTVTVMTLTGPTAVTLDAEHMSRQSWRERRLHGYIQNDGGIDCEVRFQYGLDPLDLNLTTTWRTTYPGVCPPRGFQTGDYFYADILLAAGELGQTWYFRAQAQNTDGLSSGEILSFTLGDEAPDEGLVVVTHASTERTGISFMAHGALIAADPEAFRRGFVYMAGGYGEPTLANSVVQEGGTFGVGSYSLQIDGLTPGEEYRFRAFAENDDGVVYGNTLTATALGAPVVATRTPTDIGETSFRARGEVLSTGDTVTRRGFVYMEGNSGIPTLTDDVVDEFGLWGAAPYNLVVPGLTGGTYYRVRAFATNAIGTGYGGTITVRTIGTPDVNTNIATHIGVSTARLHGQVIDDGGSTCQWRLQWGIATGVYTDASAWTGALNSGQAFHIDATELQPDTTYYFRAQARNAVGLASGAELSFNTTDGIGDPSFLTATPLSGTEIGLVWLTGGGADNTQIQMQQNSYPASHLHGETVYYGNESATTVTGLTPGTTYYFRAWGEGAGNYSADYTQDMATTLAGAPDDGWTDPDEPDDWFQTPDHTGLENFPLYDQVNNLFDSFGLPNTTGWVILSLILAAIIGMLALVLSNGNVWVAMAAGGGVLVFTTWIGLLMWWILVIYLVCVGLYAFIRSRV